MYKYLTQAQLDKKQKLNQLRSEKNLEKIGGNNLPASYSLKSLVQEVYNQGSEGSCTANAFCGAYKMLEPDKSFNPSRAYVYWKERLIEDGNNPSRVQDSGADVQDGIDWVCKNGVCSEQLWPYNVQNVDKEPPKECDIEAEKHKLGGSKSIPLDLNQIKTTISSGRPVLIAIGVYSSFEGEFTRLTGVVQMPSCVNYGDSQDPIDPFVGGHEMLIVGYNDNIQYFTVLNSWGPEWGQGGFCYIPYSYISDPNLCFERVMIYF